MKLKANAFLNTFIVALMILLFASTGNAAQQDKVVLQFSYAPFGFSADAERTFWSKYIGQFEKENPNIKINMTWESWDNFHQKTHMAAETGKVPDLSYCSPGTNMPIAARGLVLPVDDVIKALGGPKVFVESNLSPFQMGGKTYGVPNCDNNIVLAYRKDILRKAGFNAPPKTWDELVK
ncbi:MAG: extracellular solute-binding protein, partial [Deltaproteobacteria bacterium]|nr:extracellular solute-binding protein [Deltaproteobacteria bacterium]